MLIKQLHKNFSICKLQKISDINYLGEFVFVGKTDDEISLVCETNQVPDNTVERDDNWLGLKIDGQLDFSLIGILSKITSILAENKIGVFVVSTYNTDYIFVKDFNYQNAVNALRNADYEID